MDSTLVAAIIGVAGALLGVALTRWFDLLERRAKHQEWLDEFRLPKQIDTLSALYADTVLLQEQLSQLHTSALKYAILDTLPSSLGPVTESSVQFKKSRSLAYIYLSEEGRQASATYLHSTEIVIRLAEYIFSDSPDISKTTLNNLTEASEKAHQAQQSLVDLLKQQLAATSFSTDPKKKNTTT